MKGIRKIILITALAAAVQCFGQAPDKQDAASNAPLDQGSKQSISSPTPDEKAPKGGRHSWLLGGIFGVLGFGVVIAFRQYANKIVPDMPRPARSNSSHKNLNGGPIEISVKKSKW